MAKQKHHADIGHNNPVNASIVQGHITFIARKEAEKELIDQAIKDRLNAAKKDDGLLKTGLKKAVKKLRMTQKQRQAKTEIEIATDYYTDLCKDLPLFAQNFGTEAEEEEDAA